MLAVAAEQFSLSGAEPLRDAEGARGWIDRIRVEMAFGKGSCRNPSGLIARQAPRLQEPNDALRRAGLVIVRRATMTAIPFRLFASDLRALFRRASATRHVGSRRVAMQQKREAQDCRGRCYRATSKTGGARNGGWHPRDGGNRGAQPRHVREYGDEFRPDPKTEKNLDRARPAPDRIGRVVRALHEILDAGADRFPVD